MTNTAIKNAILNDAAQEIRNEIPSFEAWYKSLDEFKNLKANADGILDLTAIDNEISNIYYDAFNSWIKGETVETEKAECVSDKRKDLIAAKTFIRREAHYAYTDIANMIDTIAHHVSAGEFDDAIKDYTRLKGYHADDISNPIASIDMDAIKAEIRYAKHECVKFDAHRESIRTTVREGMEGVKNGYAIIGGIAAITADVILGVKVLKKILK